MLPSNSLLPRGISRKLNFSSSLHKNGPSSKFSHQTLASQPVKVKIQFKAENNKFCVEKTFSRFQIASLAANPSYIRQITLKTNSRSLATLRLYCSQKEAQNRNESNAEKNEQNPVEEAKADTKESKNPPQSPQSPFEQISNPFGRRGSNQSNEAPFQFVSEPPSSSDRPVRRKATPRDIITINTEKGVFKRLWKGMGLSFYNFVVASPNWTVVTGGRPLPEFWKKQIYTARLDAVLMFWAICAITGSDVLLFAAWLTGAIFFPGHLLPSVFRVPSRAEVRDYVYEYLKDTDTENTGLATIEDAKFVLRIVESSMSKEVVQQVLDAAGATREHVDYTKLADVIVGNA